LQPLRIVIKATDTGIAFGAQQATDCSGIVVMVDAEASSIGRMTADCTFAILHFEQALVVLHGHAVLFTELRFPAGVAADCRICLPSSTVASSTFAGIGCTPLSPCGVEAYATPAL